MPEGYDVTVNGRQVRVQQGMTAAAAMMLAGACRKSVSGEARAPVCGIGICFECRASVDGVAHVRTCQVLCRPGMAIDVA